jgi:ABC-2 type transport system permease protein
VSTVTAQVIPRLDHTGRVTQARVVLSEWTKLRSVRSTLWSLGVAVVLTIGLPLLVATVRTTRAHPDRHGPSPLEIASVGVNISQLAIAVLGVLLITGEYSTGMIRATFTAVPKRLPVLWAKIGVYAVVSFVLMLPCVVIAFFGSQAILSHKNLLQISFSHPGVARTVIGGAVYLMLVGVFALALGAIVRSTAGGISAFAAIFFVIPPLLNILPSSWNNAIAPWLPDSAARAVFQLTHDSHSLAPGPGLALFAGYCALAIAIAAVLLVRRDT